MVACLGALKTEHHLVNFVNFLEKLFYGTSSGGCFCTVENNIHVKILTNICSHMKELYCKNSSRLIASNYFCWKVLLYKLKWSYIPLWLRDMYNIREQKF